MEQTCATFQKRSEKNTERSVSHGRGVMASAGLLSCCPQTAPRAFDSTPVRRVIIESECFLSLEKLPLFSASDAPMKRL